MDIMVSKVACTSSEGAMNYYDQHLSRGDYFVATDDPKLGVWMGGLAAEIGLDNKPITRQDFQAFLKCDLEAMGRAAHLKRARASDLKYIEFTYTAPKSVSIAAALDERLKEAVFQAVREEMAWFEHAAAARDRRGDLAGKEVTRATENFMAAMFRHDTSRTNDPNIHVHTLIGNMTLDRERNQLLALHYGDMLEFRKVLDARIHNNLARRCADMGYTVEVAENGFALGEVPREAVELFSSRHRQVEAVRRLLTDGHSVNSVKALITSLRQTGGESILGNYEELAKRLGRASGPAMSHRMADENAVLLTRPEKVEIDSTELASRTLAMLREAGLAVRPPRETPVPVTADLGSAIAAGVAAVFEKQSVARLDELVGTIARLAPGALTNEALADRLRSDRRFVIARLSLPDRENGVELATTQELIAEERQLLLDVKAGLQGGADPLIAELAYQLPHHLQPSRERVAAIVADAKRAGEEISADQAETWLRQFAAIHRYVSTSNDQFLNIRGGAGVGKTFCMEILVADSLNAGRPVILAAPYGEQSRVNLRREAGRLRAEGKIAVAEAFGKANTVDHWLMKARHSSAFAATLRGADIYVDEASLLDTPTASALVRLVRENGARLIFQGDVQQKDAVGRGAPLQTLQDRLDLGMAVERASISRRQHRYEDKILAQHLSSGDSELFQSALETFISRGDVKQVDPDLLSEEAAARIIAARAAGEKALAFSSVHRLCDAVSEEIHQRTKEANPKLAAAQLDAWKLKDLQPAELLSAQFYAEGDQVEWQNAGRLRHATVAGVTNGEVMIRQGSQTCRLGLEKVTALYERKIIERCVGAQLALTEKITHHGKTHERNSLHRIKKFAGGFAVFDSGLRLAINDGRLRQGDVLTTDKAQGAKGAHVFWLEDNRSMMAMADRKTVHVGFTRHVKSVSMLVESVEMFRSMAIREHHKIPALELAESGGPSRWLQHEGRLVGEKRAAVASPSPTLLSRRSRMERWTKGWRYRRLRPVLLAAASQRVRAHVHATLSRSV